MASFRNILFTAINVFTFIALLLLIARADQPEDLQAIDDLQKQANAAWIKGDLVDSERLGQQAIALARKYRPTTDITLANLLLTRGLIVQRLFGAAAAISVYNEALEIQERVLGATHANVAFTLYYLSGAHEALGRFSDAEAMLKRSIAVDRIARSPRDFHVGLHLMGLGLLLQRQNRLDEALSVFFEASSILMEYAPANVAVAVRCMNFAIEITITRKDFVQTERLLEQSRNALANARKRISEFPNLANNLLEIDMELEISRSRLEVARKRFPEALQAAEHAVQIAESRFGPEDWNISRAIDASLETYFAMGAWDKAASLSDRKIALYRRSLPETSIDYVPLWRTLGLARAREGKIKEALAAYDRATETAAQANNRDRLGSYKAAFIESAQLHLRAANLWRDSMQQHADAAFIAMQWPHRTAAARAVAQATARSAADPRIGQLIRQRESMIGKIRNIESRLATELGHIGDQRKEIMIAQLRAESGSMMGKIADFDREIATTLPHYSDFADPMPLSIMEVRKLLAPDEVLIVISTQAPYLIIFAVSQDRMGWHWVNDAGVVEAKAVKLRCAVAITDPACGTDFNTFDLKSDHELYRVVFNEHISPVIEGKRHFLIVADGAFAALPFSILVSEPPPENIDRAAALKAARWLIRDRAVTVLPAVSSLRALRASRSSSDNDRLPFVGFGDPRIGTDGPMQCSEEPPVVVLAARGPTSRRASDIDARYLSRSGTIVDGITLADPNEVRKLPRLPDTRCELFWMAKRLGATRAHIYVNGEATEKRIKAMSQSHQLARYRVIAFATHGLMSGDIGVAEPALVLTPPESATPEDDGLLTSGEVASLELDADWIVLSACNTAAGESEQAESLSGLAKAFFYAGARSILVSHWPVYSEAAVAITTRTFDTIVTQPAIGRAEALRQAMISIIDSSQDAQRAHPAYWAPFSFVGPNR